MPDRQPPDLNVRERSPHWRWIAAGAGAAFVLVLGAGAVWWSLGSTEPVRAARDPQAPATSAMPDPRTNSSPLASRNESELAHETIQSADRSRPSQDRRSPSITLPELEFLPRNSGRQSLPESPDIAALSRRGRTYVKDRKYALAKPYFDEILRLRPKDIEALNDRCWVNAILGNLNAALKDCENALQVRPSHVDALDSRALVKLKSGLPRDAIYDYDAALKIHSQKASSLYGRGIAKQRVGNTASGDNDIARAKSIDPGIADEFASYGIR